MGGNGGNLHHGHGTGLNGTAMPSYADVFDEPDGENVKPGDAWNLVSYVLSLRASDKPGVQVASQEGAAVNAAYRGDLARAGYTAPAPEPAQAGGNKESKP